MSIQTTEGVQKPPPRYNVVWRWGLLVAYAACIFTLSAIPGRSLPGIHINDKVIHAAEYSLLSVLLCRALAGHMTARSQMRIACLSALAAILYGATDEFHQLFVLQRSAELSDFVADSLGATLAAWGWLKAGTRWRWMQ